jgi:hypothetical protein
MTDPHVRTKQRPARVFHWWAALVAVLIISTGGFALAYLHASAATTKAQHTADCVNGILGVRAPLTNADHANERQKINGQIVAERDQAQGLKALIVAKTQAEGRAAFRLYQRGVDEFEKALNDWKIRDDQIAAAKRAHPLGKC